MRTIDVPQADDLATVRTVIGSITRGQFTIADVAAETGFSERHAGYRLHAARILGFVEVVDERAGHDLFGLTPRGNALLTTPRGSAEERDHMRRAINESPQLRVFAPDLMADPAPARDALTRAIMHHSGLAFDTARRRAGALLAWRRQLPVNAPPKQLSLF